ncbi:transposase [Streptomyces abikoensis]|uniref:transposase n=1 Tax=Streptomyces TaxID=1883 RepID=UPI0033C0F983
MSGRWKDHREVISGILFRIRTGIPWRDLPRRFGSRQNLLRLASALVRGRDMGEDLPGCPG